MSARERVKEHLPAGALDFPSFEGLSPDAQKFLFSFMKNEVEAIIATDLSKIEERSIQTVAALYKALLLQRTKKYKEFEECLGYIDNELAREYAAHQISPFSREGCLTVISRNPACESKLEAVIRCLANFREAPTQRTDIVQYLTMLFDSFDLHIEHDGAPYKANGWSERYYESNFLYYQLFLLVAIEGLDGDNIYEDISAFCRAKTNGNKELAERIYETIKKKDPKGEIVSESWRKYWDMSFGPTPSPETVIQTIKEYHGYDTLCKPDLVAGARLQLLSTLNSYVSTMAPQLDDGGREYIISVLEHEFNAINEFFDANAAEANKHRACVEFYPKAYYYSVLLCLKEDLNIRQEYLKLCYTKFRTTIGETYRFFAATEIMISLIILEKYDEASEFFFDNDSFIIKCLDNGACPSTYKIDILTALYDAAVANHADAYVGALGRWFDAYPHIPKLAEAAQRAKGVRDRLLFIIRWSTFAIQCYRERRGDIMCVICCCDIKAGSEVAKCNACNKIIGHCWCIGDYIDHDRNRYNVVCPHCRAVSGNQFIESMRRMQAYTQQEVAATAATATTAATAATATPAAATVPVVSAPPAAIRVGRRAAIEARQRVSNHYRRQRPSM